MRIYLRVLMPFARDPSVDVAMALGSRTLRDKNVWSRPAEPHRLYFEELLPAVTNATISPDPADYWQMTETTRGMIFPNDLKLRLSKVEGECDAAASSKWGVELFLTDHSLGMLSIALEIDAHGEYRRHDAPLDNAAKALAMLYGLSQIDPAKSYVASMRRPHPKDDPDEWAQRVARGLIDKTPDVPDTEAPIAQRLGIMGGAWRIPELVQWLLPFSYQPFGIDHTSLTTGIPKRPGQFGQFGIYAVVRLDESEAPVSFTLDGPMGDLLASLAQLQEPGHPGNHLVESGVSAAALNSRHLAASTPLASVHIVADQPGKVQFNDQRPHNLMSKYFVPTLLAHYQRRYVELQSPLAASGIEQLSHSDECEVLTSAPTDTTSSILAMTKAIAKFEACFALTTVSHRHVINRWFSLCVAGEQITARLAHLREVARRLESIALWRSQHRTHLAVVRHMKTVAHVQQNIEWIELFIIAVYAIEAVHIIGGAARFGRAYVLPSLFLLPIISASLTFVFLFWCSSHGPMAPNDRPNLRDLWRSNQVRLIASLLVAFLLWFGVGMCCAVQPESSSTTSSH